MVTYRKGHRPHNRGDSHVDEHYRERPKMKEKAAPRRIAKRPPRDSMSPFSYESNGYYQGLGNNFLKRWFS